MIDGELLVLAPLAIEALALRRAGLRVVTIGVGRRRVARKMPSLASDPATRLLVAGFGGALDDALAPGDVVVADEVQGPDGAAFACGDAEALCSALRREGLDPVRAPVATRDHIVSGDERATVAAGGARVVDMESFWLRELTLLRSVAVIRVVVDTPSAELSAVTDTVINGWRAHRVLRRVGRALQRQASEAL